MTMGTAIMNGDTFWVEEGGDVKGDGGVSEFREPEEERIVGSELCDEGMVSVDVGVGDGEKSVAGTVRAARCIFPDVKVRWY